MQKHKRHRPTLIVLKPPDEEVVDEVALTLPFATPLGNKPSSLLGIVKARYKHKKRRR